MMTYTELKSRQVINIRDCKCLGKVIDLELEECGGCIHKLIVGESNRLLELFKPEKRIVIPFCHIRQIGPDIILVDISVC